MDVLLFDSKVALGRAAADRAATAIADAIEARGHARIVAATGASQFEFLGALTARTDVPWGRVEMFHLDEYVGLTSRHPASFRRYLLDRLIQPAGIGTAHLIEGEGDPDIVCAELGKAILESPVDVAFVGIGENGHLAFNDPPADFETGQPYIVVTLDDACRRQQVGEGWFKGLDEVPRMAISMSIRQILRSREILCVVPDQRKAEAVRNSLCGPVTATVPASALQTHSAVTVFLDRQSASLLPPGMAVPAR